MPLLARLRNNLGLKLLSLALAVGAWIYLRFSPNPVLAARFEQRLSVPIVVLGLPAGRIARLTEQDADVAVSVPRSQEGAVRPEDVRAVLDLGGKDVGAYNVPVQVIAPKYQIDSLSPASVTLTIERVEERVEPLVVRYVGDARGRAVVAAARTVPRTVVVRGAASILGRLSAVRVEVPLPTGPQHLDAMLRPIPIDGAGRELEDLTVSPNLVRTDVRFERPGGGR